MANPPTTKARTKRPTALKRDIQHGKKRLLNKAFQNRVKTAMRRFEQALASKEATPVQEHLNAVYSLMDKGVKRGIFQLNKASRTKARFTARAYAQKTA